MFFSFFSEAAIAARAEQLESARVRAARLPVSFPRPMKRPTSATIATADTAATAAAPLQSPSPAAAAAQAAEEPDEGWTTFTHWKSNPDDTVTTEFFTQPAFRRDGSTWKPVDPTVRPRSDANAPAGAENAVRPILFGKRSSRIVQLILDGGPVTISSNDLAIGQPEIDSHGVTYRNAARDTDLRYRVTNSELKEEIVLRSSAAPKSFTFHISDPANQLGSAAKSKGGSQRFSKNIDADLSLRLAPAFAYEKARLDQGFAPSVTSSADMTLVAAGDGFDVTVSVDDEWLSGKSYPIVLDPTAVFSRAGGTMYAGWGLSSAHDCAPDPPGCFGLNDVNSSLGAGSFVNSSLGWYIDKSRSFYRFTLTSIPSGSVVTAATLSQFTNGCIGAPFPSGGSNYHCDDNTYALNLHELTQDWDPDFYNWDDLQAITAGANFSGKTRPPFTISLNSDGSCISGCFTETWSASGLVNKIQSWVNGAPNYGFVIKLGSEFTNSGGPSWAYLGQYDAQFAKPSLSVTYKPPPGPPGNVNATPGNGQATLTWSPSSTNGGSAISSYTVTTFQSDGTQIGTPASVCGTCTSYTKTGLTNGLGYYFKIFATNADGLSSSTVTSNTVTPQAAPELIKTVCVINALAGACAPSQPYVVRGQAVRYTLTVTNPQAGPMTLTSLTDAMPATLAPASPTGPAVTVDGVPCTSTSTPSCVLNGKTLSISNVTLAANASKVFTYTAIAIGSDRGCSTVVNNALASNGTFGSTPASVPITVCDVGLGLEKWWSYVERDMGPMAQAFVNVANGNLVVQQVDSAPVQARGHLAYVLRRTYNSEDSTILTLPGSFGAGWTLNLTEAGNLAGFGIGSSGLFVPSAESILNPLAITLIDRDGTRHVFQPKGLAATAAIDVTALKQAGSTSALAALVPKVLTEATGTRICVDQTYTAPPGVHLGLWRFIQINSNGSCTASPSTWTSPAVLGFAAVRPDRVRQEFSWNGRLISLTDASGVELRYKYASAPVAGIDLGNLLSVYESRSCTDPAVATCRAFRFTYVSSTQTDVSDPAGRVTKYFFDTATPKHLIRVQNPDGTDVDYTYGGCGGSANQLCSATDPRNNATTFTYSAPLVGLPRLASLTTRRGPSTTTNFTYFASPDQVTADQGSQRRTFITFDLSGRVSQVDEGDTSGNVLHRTNYTWDSAGCRQPDGVADNNLCRMVRDSGSGVTTPDEDTTFKYNAEGAPILIRRANSGSNLDSTSGYRAQFIQSGGTVLTADDTVTGSGNVTSAARPSGVEAAKTLFAISDQTQSLTPRGNAAGTGYAPYLTTFKVDNNTAFNPSRAPTAPTCADPNNPSANTGGVCEERAPAFDGTNAAIMRYTYDTYGARLTMTTPKAIAEQPSSPPQFVYTYYTDPELDRSGLVEAEGWLKAISDPAGKLVVFAYDRAGNVTRTWDRNATQGYTLAVNSLPSSTAFSEVIRGLVSAPGRYVTSTTDQLGNRTTFTLDNNGNQLTIRPPRGNQAANATFDITQTFDANDNVLTHLMPAEAAAGKSTTFAYDAFDNQTSITDPNARVTKLTYDSVNRLTAKAWTRGPFPTDPSAVPPGCRQSTVGDAPIPVDRLLCLETMAYDGVDNRTGVSDGNAQTTNYTYDGVHREIRRLSPRFDGTLTTLRTDTVYDADGNVTDVCSPRQFAEGGSSSCVRPAQYSLARNFDVAGRVSSQITYRSSGTPLTTSFAYDADGNTIRSTNPNGRITTFAYDLLGRRTSTTLPRDASSSFSTVWNYDPSGNVTSVIKPGTLDTGTGSDGAATFGSTCTQPSPCVLTTGKNYSSLTLTGGAWVTVAGYNGSTGGSLEIKVTGAVSICSTCRITLDGKGPGGGLGGTSLSAPGGNGAGTGGGKGGGGNATTGGGGGGAGHAAAGVIGKTKTGAGAAGAAGVAYGATDLSDFANKLLVMGSGGGGGGRGGTVNGAPGGAGGGFIHITAESIDVQGTISANGNPGGSLGGTVGGGGGGGGSGGSIWLTATNVNIANALSIATALGPGGTGAGGDNGGDGARGRVRIDADVLTGAGMNGNSSWGSSVRRFVGRITAYSYDSANRLIDTIEGSSSEVAAQVGLVDFNGGINTRTQLAYDADGNVVARFEPRAFSTATRDAKYMTRTDFDVDGRPTAQFSPRYDGSAAPDAGLNSAQTTQCPTTGVTPATIAGIPAYPAGTGICVTRFSYDPAGNRTRVTLATATNSSANRFVAYTFTDDNLVETITPPSPIDGTHPASVSTTFLYDGVGREVKRTAPLGRQMTAEYWSDGLLKASTGQPNQAGTVTHRTSYTYDANGNRKTATDPSGKISRSNYFTDDLISDISDPLVNKTSYVYDAVGNTIEVKSPSAQSPAEENNTAGLPTTYTYTYDNLVQTATVPFTPTGSERRRTTYGYDRGGRKTSQQVDKVNASNVVIGAGGIQRYTYYANDRLSLETGRTGTQIGYSYDPAGNPKILVDPSGSTMTATYYLDGLPRLVNDGSRSNLFAYDGAGSRIARQDQVNGSATTFTTTYTYGDSGFATGMSSTVPATSGSVATSWTYDEAGRIKTENDPSRQITVTYDSDDTVTSFLVKSGATTVASWTYPAYDNNYRVKDQTFTGVAATPGTLVTENFHYDYDDAGRLTNFARGATSKTITWDRSGNRRSYGAQQFHYNADDSIKTATDLGGGNTKTFGYAVFGGTSTDGCTNYTYDGFDRMTQASAPSGTGCPSGQAVTYEYDALDRQRSHTETVGKTAVHYDGLNQSVAIETAPTTNIDTVYVLAPWGTPKALKVNTPVTPTIEYMTGDGMGNITTVTNATGGVKCTVRYDPFGSPINALGSDHPCHTGTKPANDVFFRSGRRDAGSGTYQMGSRTYDPGKGSFLTPDSYRQSDSSKDLSIGVDPLTRNTYTYVNGDPVNLSDPTGHRIPSEHEEGPGYVPPPKDDPNVTLSVDGEEITLKYSQSQQLNAQYGGSLWCGLGAHGEVTVWNPEYKNGQGACGVWITVRPGGLRQGIANFLGGALNSLTFGNARRILSGLGQEDKVDYESGNFRAGEIGAGVVDAVVAVKGVVSAVRGIRAAVRARRAVRAAELLVKVGEDAKALSSLAKVADDAPEVASALRTGARSAVEEGPDLTSVYRVEGPGNARLKIGAGGAVGIKGDKTLFLNFGSRARAEEFLAKRIAQGFEGTVIKTFKVPTSYVDSLRAAAVTEDLARQFPHAPFLVDVTKAADQFGLRRSQFAELSRNIVQGSGAVL